MREVMIKVREFVKFLPVLCFDGSSMGSVNARAVLDIGTVCAFVALLELGCAIFDILQMRDY